MAVDDDARRSLAGGTDETPTGEGESWRLYDLDRTTAFSDGVIAIAITLLVLTIEPPDISGDASPTRLLEAIWDQGPAFFSFAVSFLVIARFWIIHHRFFGGLRAVDGTMVSLNLVFLALVVLIPYPTDLYGDYNSNPVALTALALVMAAASTVSLAMIAHASRRGLLTAEWQDRTGPASLRWALIPATFLLAVPVAFLVSSEWAPLVWILLGFVRTHTGHSPE